MFSGGDALTPPHLQNLSSFSKDILVCGLLEAIINARSSPLSYSSSEDYENGNFSAAGTRGPLLQAAELCRMLWPGRLHDYWDKLAPSHPELEGAVNLRLAILQLNRVSGVARGSSSYSREAAVAATEVFCSIARSGFHEVSTPRARGKDPPFLSLCK